MKEELHPCPTCGIQPALYNEELSLVKDELAKVKEELAKLNSHRTQLGKFICEDGVSIEKLRDDREKFMDILMSTEEDRDYWKLMATPKYKDLARELLEVVKNAHDIPGKYVEDLIKRAENLLEGE